MEKSVSGPHSTSQLSLKVSEVPQLSLGFLFFFFSIADAGKKGPPSLWNYLSSFLKAHRATDHGI